MAQRGKCAKDTEVMNNQSLRSCSAPSSARDIWSSDTSEPSSDGKRFVTSDDLLSLDGLRSAGNREVRWLSNPRHN